MVVAVMMALLVGVTPVPQTRPAIDAEERATMDAATIAISVGQPEPALTAIEPIIKAYQANLATEKRRTFCGMSDTQSLAYLAMAAKDKQEAVALAPAYCEALYIKGFALIDLKRVVEARAVYEQLLVLAPWHSHFLTELGQSYTVDQNWPKMIDLCTKAAEFADLSAEGQIKAEQGAAWRCMAYALVEQGKYDDAEALYRKSLVLDPSDSRARSELKLIADLRAMKAAGASEMKPGLKDIGSTPHTPSPPSPLPR